ncbi:MAG TPA: hypothetical protein VFI99_03595 [Nocardioides sp.]|nr:hypothetical protein [Nocardioides sp.]
MSERNLEPEQPDTPPDVDPTETGQEFDEPERTGVEEVDNVLADLQGLQNSPVEEHPDAFEQAHERLRQALDNSSDA